MAASSPHNKIRLLRTAITARLLSAESEERNILTEDDDDFGIQSITPYIAN